MSEVEALDRPCPACDRTTGDHTLREWADCLRFQAGVPDDADPDREQVTDLELAEFASAAVRERFDLERGTIVADHAVVRSAFLRAASGVGVDAKVPALFQEFQVGVEGRPVTVARVAYIAPAHGVRAYGRLVRDGAEAAAKHARGLILP